MRFHIETLLDNTVRSSDNLNTNSHEHVNELPVASILLMSDVGSSSQ